MWHRAASLPEASCGITSGSSSNRRGPGEQHVVRRVAEQLEREGQPLRRRTTAAAGCGHRADLAGADRQPVGVERAARATSVTSVSPYQLSSTTVPSGDEQVERELQPGRRWRWCARRGPPPRRVVRAARTRRPSAAATSARDGSTSTRVTRRPGSAASSRATQQPTMPGADDRDPVADERAGVPQRVDRGLDGAGQHRALGRHAVGHHGARPRPGTTYARLVRVQAEHRAAAQRGGSLLDHADVEVAVLHRSGEVAVLEGRAHRVALARGHAAVEDQRLGAAADAGAQRADQHLARGRGRATATGRISPTPGSRTQNACASIAIISQPFSVALEPAHRFRRTNSCTHVNGEAVSAVQSDLTNRVFARVGPANMVTFVRGVLSVLVAAMVVESFFHPTQVTLLVLTSTVALALDWVDGQVARRTHTESAFGARFDMEVDAFLILVLSVYVARSVRRVGARDRARALPPARRRAGAAVAAAADAAALLGQGRRRAPGHRAHRRRGRRAARDAHRRCCSRSRWRCSPSPSAARCGGCGAAATATSWTRGSPHP